MGYIIKGSGSGDQVVSTRNKKRTGFWCGNLAERTPLEEVCVEKAGY